MPFPWLQPTRVKRPDRRAEVYRRELEDRAALLLRLGFSRARARSRLGANVRWDFEVGTAQAPIALRDIDAIVDRVYRRGGAGAGEPTV